MSCFCLKLLYIACVHLTAQTLDRQHDGSGQRWPGSSALPAQRLCNACPTPRQPALPVMYLGGLHMPSVPAQSFPWSPAVMAATNTDTNPLPTSTKPCLAPVPYEHKMAQCWIEQSDWPPVADATGARAAWRSRAPGSAPSRFILFKVWTLHPAPITLLHGDYRSMETTGARAAWRPRAPGSAPSRPTRARAARPHPAPAPQSRMQSCLHARMHSF